MDQAAEDPKLLEIFCRDAEEGIVTMRKAIENGDIKRFTTTVHATKTVLAHLGENEAAAEAYMLEKAGLNGDNGFITANTENFIKTLENIIEGLKPKKSSEGEDSGITEDKLYLTEELKKVQIACEDYNAKAAYAILDSLKGLSWKADTLASLGQIRDTIFLHSDFEDACKKIDVLVDKLKLS